jgi:DNA-binding transcriptional MerR regulator
VNASAQFLNPSEAARRLGISAKALRLYEQRGLLAPVRTAAGWRVYGPGEMARAGEIVALRELGLSLRQVKRVLDGNAGELEAALAAHQAALEQRRNGLADAIERVCRLRADLAGGKTPVAGEIAKLIKPLSTQGVAFDLPWPWGGERFVLQTVWPLNYIVGPLFSGKTRLAKRLAEALPNAAFVGLERLADGGGQARARIDADPVLKSRLDRTLNWLIEDGATVSDALIALLAGLEAAGPAILVIDMVEQGLDQATQQALIAYLRRHAPDRRPLFLLTRSSAILDLDAVGPHERIIFCPANHSPPVFVSPYRGAPGYEAVASCLGSPAVRARTDGVIAAWAPGRDPAAAGATG